MKVFSLEIKSFYFQDPRIHYSNKFYTPLLHRNNILTLGQETLKSLIKIFRVFFIFVGILKSWNKKGD